MSNTLIVAIIAAVPGLLSPVVVWFLNQQGVSRQRKQLETLMARIDLIEKLSDSRAIPAQFDNDIEKLKVREMRAVLAEIEALSETEQARIAIPVAGISRWKRATLNYDQISLKGRIYKGLFYAFNTFAVTGAAAALYVATIPGTRIVAIFGSALYLMIGLIFRRAAVRTYEADKRMAAATQLDGEQALPGRRAAEPRGWSDPLGTALCLTISRRNLMYDPTVHAASKTEKEK